MVSIIPILTLKKATKGNVRMYPVAKILLILAISIATGADAADDVAGNEYAEMFPGLSPGLVSYDFLTTLDEVQELWNIEPLGTWSKRSSSSIT